MDITMPQLGETVTEGTVTRWLKQIGDEVAPDELIFEVSTDKVDSEVPAPGGGYLVEILVPEGETVPVGTKLAVLGDSPPSGGGGDGGGGAATAEAPAQEAPAAEAAAPAEAPAQETQETKPEPEPVEAVEVVDEAPVPEAAAEGGGATGGSEADEPAGARAEAAAASAEAEEKGIPTGAAAAAGGGGSGGGGSGGGQAGGGSAGGGAPAPAPAEDAPAAGPESGNGNGSGSGMLLSPVVRRLVTEHNLDPAQIQGTGEGGRVTRSDVLAFIDRQGGSTRQTPAAAAAAAQAPVAEAPAASPSAPAQAAPAPATQRQAAPAAARAGNDEVVPFDNMRRRTAEHMRRSKDTSAHVLTAVEVDFHAVDRARSAHRDEWKDREGFSLTYLPFVARAVCDALAEFPHLNASVGENELTVHHYVNLGIAVDLDQRGLIVPVIKGAEGKRLRQLSREIRDLAERARSKKLGPDDVTGGTFTITNPGPYGTLISAPIINQPQVAILATEGVKKRPVVVETPEGDSIAIHPVGLIGMSWDHRAIDGAYASKFLHTIRTIIETRDWEAELA